MITIHKGLKQCKLVSDDLTIHRELDDKLAVDCPGHEYSEMFRRQLWDGKNHFYNFKQGTFPTGLWKMVLEVVSDRKYEIVGEIEAPESQQPYGYALCGVDGDSLTLRDYQSKAVQQIIHARAGIVKAATNSGKTEIAAEVVRRLGHPTLFLVHRKELLYQTVERLSTRLAMPVGMIGDGQVDFQEVMVVMPTSMTYKKNKRTKSFLVKPEFEQLMDYPVLILDECHVYPDNRVSAVVKASNAYYRIAMSGTPLLNEEEDNMALIGAFGPVAFEITNKELIDLQVSSVPTCRIYKIDENGLDKLDYQSAYKLGITQSMVRNDLICQLAHSEAWNGKGVLIVVKEIDHGKILSYMLPDSAFAHGGLDTATRMSYLRKFTSGEIDILIASTILDEGVDTDRIDVLIHAAGGKTSKRLLQRIGRGLRKKASGRLDVIDFLDVSNRYLLEHSADRIGVMRMEGFEVKLVPKI